MNQEKKIAYISNAQILPADDLLGTRPDSVGKFFLSATMIIDKNSRSEDGIRAFRKFESGEPIRTSYLVRIDVEKNEFETMNTIYKIIPNSQIAAYKMTDPG